jgi:GPH family glycoside/pentoside/hexuronide:cation symporter
MVQAQPRAVICQIAAQGVTMTEVERVPIRTKVAWGIGSAAERVALAATGAFALFYYNQVVGMQATLAGLAMSISLLLDGAIDPVMGSISDRTRSRLGRRHPYLYAAPLPLALSLIAIFNPPPGLAAQSVWLFVWFAAFVSLLRLSLSVYDTPHLALGGELSSDYTERSKVMAYNTFFGFSASAIMTWSAYTFFFRETEEYSRGLKNPDAYPAFAYTAAGIAFVAMLASAWFTRDVIPRLPKPPEHLPRFSPLEFARDIGKALTNANYLWLLIAFFFLSLVLGVREGLLIYVQTFFWGLTSAQIKWYVLGSVAGVVVSFIAVARLNTRFDKRRTIIGSGLVMTFAPAVLPLLRVSDVVPTPAEAPWMLWLVIGSHAVLQCATTMLGISVMSALADIADQNELKHGVRQEGVLYSTRSLFSKIDVAVGTFVAGLAIDLIRLKPGVEPADVSPTTIMHLGLLDALFPIVPGLIAVFFYSRYRIDRASFLTTREALLRARAERQVVKAPVAAEPVL